VEFTNIVDIRQVAPQAAAPVPMTAPVTPSQPVPASSPIAAAPSPGGDVSRHEEIAHQVDESAPSSREGFHFGVGLGAMALDIGPLAQVQAHFDFTFGRPAYRLSANLGIQSMNGTTFASLSVDNLFQFNVNDIYSFGVGLQIGGATSSWRSYLYASPVIQPVIIKLGDRGQHQLSLTASIVALSTIAMNGYTGATYTFAGTPQVFVGYSFLF